MYRVILSSINNDRSLKWKDKQRWLVDNLGFTEDEARDAVYALEGYTDRGSHFIHMQDFEGYTGDMYRKDASMIDKVLTHPNMPKYSGTLYRGLHVPDYKSEELEEILNSGVWKEPGITSFTTEKSHAESFANMGGTLADPVLVTLEGNRHGCEIGFLSDVGGEGEVLYPSSIAKHGLKIVKWNKIVHYRDRPNKRTGEPVVIQQDYFVYVRDV